jgi:hypothetical protein
VIAASGNDAYRGQGATQAIPPLLTSGLSTPSGQANRGQPGHGQPNAGRRVRRAVIAGAAIVAAIAAACVGIALAATDGGGGHTAPAAGAAVAGVWTGTYTCNQGLTGVRLDITASGGDTLHAVAVFYPVASNPGTANGSYEMSGSYSAGSGLVLTAVSWISQPAGYVMVSLSAPPPSGNSMQGSVEGPNCTTFSVTR